MQDAPSRLSVAGIKLRECVPPSRRYYFQLNRMCRAGCRWQAASPGMRAAKLALSNYYIFKFLE